MNEMINFKKLLVVFAIVLIGSNLLLYSQPAGDSIDIRIEHRMKRKLDISLLNNGKGKLLIPVVFSSTSGERLVFSGGYCASDTLVVNWDIDDQGLHASQSGVPYYVDGTRKNMVIGHQGSIRVRLVGDPNFKRFNFLKMLLSDFEGKSVQVIVPLG